MTHQQRDSQRGQTSSNGDAGIDVAKEGIMPSRVHDAKLVQQRQVEEDISFDCFSGPSRFSAMAEHLRALKEAGE
jgi:hypothetical protein